MRAPDRLHVPAGLCLPSEDHDAPSDDRDSSRGLNVGFGYQIDGSQRHDGVRQRLLSNPEPFMWVRFEVPWQGVQSGFPRVSAG
jgi:hypothetical protein